MLLISWSITCAAMAVLTFYFINQDDDDFPDGTT